MKMMEHLTEIMAALAGAGAYGIVGRLTRRKSDNQELNDTAVRLLRDEIDTLRQKINLVEGYNASHVKENAELKLKLKEVNIYNQILKSIPANWPFPVWMININNEYDFISPLYEEVFLKPRGKTAADCLGKNLYDVWEKEIADESVKHNRIVIETGDIFNDVETFTDGTGKVHKMQFLKWRREIPLGLIGAGIPINGFFDKFLNKK